MREPLPAASRYPPLARPPCGGSLSRFGVGVSAGRAAWKALNASRTVAIMSPSAPRLARVSDPCGQSGTIQCATCRRRSPHLELGSRRLHIAGCTTAPDAAWVTQGAERERGRRARHPLPARGVPGPPPYRQPGAPAVGARAVRGLRQPSATPPGSGAGAAGTRAAAPALPATPGRIRCRPVLGGLINDYAAA